MSPLILRLKLFSIAVLLGGLVLACSVPLGLQPDASQSGDSPQQARAVTLSPPQPVTSFVTVADGQFAVEGKPFYFAGTNNYYFMYKSDHMIDWVLYDAGRMGVKVIRSWAFMDGAAHDGYGLQPQLGVYDDSGLERLDYAISRGKQAGIRFVLALVNYWSDFGGMPQYVQWLGLNGIDDFYTKESARTAYKNYVSHVLNHVNRYTGVAYKDEPAIMGWNLTNEARNPGDPTGQHVTEWARTMSDYVHTIAPRHLISLGDEGFYNIYNDERRSLTTIGNNDTRKGHQEYNGGGGVDFNAVLELPNIHYGVLHNYAQDWWSKDEAWSLQWIRDHLRDGKRVKKPIVLEEYSRKSVTDGVRSASMKLQADIIANEGGAATMSWMLVSQMDDGMLYRDRWDDGFQIAYGDLTADLLTQHAIAMWAKNGYTTGPCVNFPPPLPPLPSFPVVISNFESAPSDAALAQAWVRNTNGNAMTPRLVAGIGGIGKAMALDWTLGTPSYAGVQHLLVAGAKDWTGADGLRIRLQADSASKDRHLTVQFRESTGEYFESNILLDTGARTVFLPWSAFSHPSWYSGGNGTKDLASMNELSLYLGGNAGTGRVIIDDIGADKSGLPTVENSTLSTSSFTYRAGSLSDLLVGITWNGNTLTSIRKEGSPLVAGNDYLVTSSGVTLKASFLESLTPATTATLAFFFSAGTSPNLGVVVEAPPVTDAVVLNPSPSYTKGSLTDVTIGITWNGKTLSVLKAGATSLVRGTHYTTTSSGVTLLATWLEAQGTGTIALGFDFSSGADGVASLGILPKPIDNPTGKLTVLYNNAQVSPNTNQAKPELKVVNSGTTAVALKDVKIRYWLTNETNATLQATLWWANTAQNSLVAMVGTNFVELSWPNSTENLPPGAFVQVHFGINATNWSTFSQSNDYSYTTGMTTFAANQKVTARLAGLLTWGVEP